MPPLPAFEHEAKMLHGIRIGGQVSMERRRGRFYSSLLASRILVTYHPSSVLCARDAYRRERLFGLLVEDLRKTHPSKESPPSSDCQFLPPHTSQSVVL
ncbi:MAG TPA: hypothetical protein VFS39_18775 [Nitrospira sp.]|nr:hypothetical protein [Nitrospira sp.]